MDLQAVTLCPRTNGRSTRCFTRTSFKFTTWSSSASGRKMRTVTSLTRAEATSIDTPLLFFDISLLNPYSLKPVFARVSEVIIWNDGCGYQNRSAVVASSFEDLSSHHLTITQTSRQGPYDDGGRCCSRCHTEGK